MESVNYVNTEFDLIELNLKNGKAVIGNMFDGERIDEADVPKGLHLYFIEHTENNFSEPLYIRKKPFNVNFMGSFVTKEEIDFDGVEELEIEDYNWEI